MSHTGSLGIFVSKQNPLRLNEQENWGEMLHNGMEMNDL